MDRGPEHVGPVKLVLGSPPYPLKGERYIGAKKKTWHVHEWIEWMVEVVTTSLTISPVVAFVVNDTYRDGRFHPAVAGLQWQLYLKDIIAERPLIWWKNAPPNRKDWYGNDWESVIVFKQLVGSVPTFNMDAVGTPPKYKTGGRFRQRDTNGKRRLGSEYPQHDLTKPRDVLRVTVGGGHMGHKSAHTNEAPYPEALIEPLILALTNKGDTVLDPFVGSGTTCSVAQRLGRGYIGIDNRQSEIDCTRERLGWPTKSIKVRK